MKQQEMASAVLESLSKVTQLFEL
jgi:hypothetical protein